MAVCPRCGVPFSYADIHVCEGRDKTKLWSLAAVGLGAILGGPLGLSCTHFLLRQACLRPDATSLCGLMIVPFVPVYIAIGAVSGASIAAVAVTLVHRSTSRRSPPTPPA